MGKTRAKIYQQFSFIFFIYYLVMLSRSSWKVVNPPFQFLEGSEWDKASASQSWSLVLVLQQCASHSFVFSESFIFISPFGT